MPAALRDALAPRPASATDPGLEAKVAFLREPASYATATRGVEAIETHWSWVFLTDRHAYKLKKPARLDHHDLATVQARRRHCEMEIRLNRRLADDVYLGATPLAVDASGGLRLGGDGAAVVDWLVCMRRLPARLMLDRAIASDGVRPREVRMLAELLAGFYRTCAPDPMDGPAFRARLVARAEANAAALLEPGAGLDAKSVVDARTLELRFVERNAALFDVRVARGLVVEGHGDLRPEHICLEVPPRIIDCLEFSRDLRVVDAAEEIAFLALECERLGSTALREALIEAYGQASGDRVPGELAHFYQAHHALARAKIAVWRLTDCAPQERDRWRSRARTYLELARRHGPLHSPD